MQLPLLPRHFNIETYYLSVKKPSKRDRIIQTVAYDLLFRKRRTRARLRE